MSNPRAGPSFGRWRLGLVVILLFTAATAACSRVPRRFALQGQVTVDGTPLESGAMAWIPTEQTGGPTCGGSITAGRFSIPAPEGARAGEYRVEITASRLSDHADSMSLDGLSTARSMTQYLPARYNAKSELVATVRSSGKNVYTFELTTK